MADIRHRVGIAAPAERVYQTLATTDGLSGWWTRDVRGDSRMGGKLEFYFGQPEPAVVMEKIYRQFGFGDSPALKPRWLTKAKQGAVPSRAPALPPPPWQERIETAWSEIFNRYGYQTRLAVPRVERPVPQSHEAHAASLS